MHVGLCTSLLHAPVKEGGHGLVDITTRLLAREISCNKLIINYYIRTYSLYGVWFVIRVYFESHKLSKDNVFVKCYVLGIINCWRMLNISLMVQNCA